MEVGHPDYYPRFGFRPAECVGLRFEGVCAEAFRAIELRPGALAVAEGAVAFPRAFAEG